MNDTPFDCECPLCRERLEKSGGTGNVLRFVNRMARAAAKVYPDILVETLAYWTYMELPKDDTVPEKNVIIRLADLDIDILHSTSADLRRFWERRRYRFGQGSSSAAQHTAAVRTKRTRSGSTGCSSCPKKFFEEYRMIFNPKTADPSRLFRIKSSIIIT